MTAKLYQTSEEVASAPRSVALGTLDGVHLGHQGLVREAMARAAGLGVRSAVALFHPRPVAVLAPARDRGAIASLARRVALVDALGVDDIVVVRFTAELAEWTPERFVDEVLVGRIGAVHAVVGRNFRFGRDRAGDAEVLAELGAERGMGVTAMPLLEAEGGPISSSRIRALIEAGEVAAAGRLLGHAPSLEGAVIRGDGRGRELGVPTANLGYPPGRVVPAEGVYAGDAVLPPGERRLRAAISIGTNPTFAGERELRVEAHLLDFDEEIYGAPMRLEFERFLRGQLAFTSVEALIAQMDADIAASRAIG